MFNGLKKRASPADTVETVWQADVFKKAFADLL